MKVGDKIYEIHCIDDVCYINRRTIKKITNKSRIICGFQPFNGLKISALDQFNRQYRCWWERGNHLNMFKCFSLEENLENNVWLFLKKFNKITGGKIKRLALNQAGTAKVLKITIP